MKKGAVIVDTRLQDFTEVIDRHLKFLPMEWSLMIFTDDLKKIQNIPTGTLRKVYKGRIEKIQDLNDYNQILTSVKFWMSIPFDKILIFQHDSELLREGIDSFLKYDYVGAAWKFQTHGGNGGLSLRSKDAMIRTLKDLPYQPHFGNEDIYFSNYLRGTLAPRDVCERFSVETVYNLGSLGAHAIDKHLTPDQCQSIRSFSLRNN